MKFEATVTLAEQITQFLTDQIVRLELKPGERIIESKLAEELSTSKAPVREALRNLEKKRLVKIIPRKGARVTEITKNQIEWFYDIFIELIGLASYKCTKNSTKKDLATINTLVNKAINSANKKDTTKYFDSMVALGLAGLKAARNPILEELIHDLMPIPLRIEFITFSDRANDFSASIKLLEACNKNIQKRNAKMTRKTAEKWAVHEKEIALKNFSCSAFDDH